MTLQSVVENAGLQRIDALKIDIEGFEDRALLPYIQTVSGPTASTLETGCAGCWEQDCVTALLNAGYSEEWRSRGDILLRLQETA